MPQVSSCAWKVHCKPPVDVVIAEQESVSTLPEPLSLLTDQPLHG